MCATWPRSDNCRMCIRVEAQPQPEDAQPEEEADDEYEPLWQGFGEEIG